MFAPVVSDHLRYLIMCYLKSVCLGQHVTVEDSYLCGYLKIKGLTEVSFETRSDVVGLTFILS